MIDRGTTVNIPARPEFNTAATTQDRVWNTMVRFDQQLNANHTYGVRWLRESSPQRNQLIPVAGRQSTTNASREEADVDQTTVGTLTSVLSNVAPQHRAGSRSRARTWRSPIPDSTATVAARSTWSRRCSI